MTITQETIDDHSQIPLVHRYDILVCIQENMPDDGTEWDLSAAMSAVMEKHPGSINRRRIEKVEDFIEGLSWGRYGVGIHQLDEMVNPTALKELVRDAVAMIKEVGEVPDRPVRFDIAQRTQR